jgi:hypothetical protein
MVNMGDYPDKMDAWNFIGGFYEGLGLLVMEDLISIDTLGIVQDSSFLQLASEDIYGLSRRADYSMDPSSPVSSPPYSFLHFTLILVSELNG